MVPLLGESQSRGGPRFPWVSAPEGRGRPRQEARAGSPRSAGHRPSDHVNTGPSDTQSPRAVRGAYRRGTWEQPLPGAEPAGPLARERRQLLGRLAPARSDAAASGGPWGGLLVARRHRTVARGRGPLRGPCWGRGGREQSRRVGTVNPVSQESDRPSRSSGKFGRDPRVPEKK